MKRFSEQEISQITKSMNYLTILNCEELPLFIIYLLPLYHKIKKRYIIISLKTNPKVGVPSLSKRQNQLFSHNRRLYHRLPETNNPVGLSHG